MSLNDLQNCHIIVKSAKLNIQIIFETNSNQICIFFFIQDNNTSNKYSTRDCTVALVI